LERGRLARFVIFLADGTTSAPLWKNVFHHPAVAITAMTVGSAKDGFAEDGLKNGTRNTV
jgi:hypothetical protein